ncbi:MAG: LamG domain-containing protein [Leptospiraceae bacterium]|nr:LamG domain-containing protein [Leptospiraceae bacterium]
MKARRCATILWAISFVPATAQATILEWGSTGQTRFRIFRHIGTEIITGKDQSQDIRMRQRSLANDSHNLLYLDFSAPHPHMLQDMSGHFSIQTSSYIPVPRAREDHTAALFNRKTNLIQVKENSRPGANEPNGDGSFFIEMWCKPVFYNRHNSLLARYAWPDGKKTGYELYIQDSQLHFIFTNLLRDHQHRLHSLSVHSPNRLGVKKWHHVAVSYDALRGQIQLYINGQLEVSEAMGNESGPYLLDKSMITTAHIRIAENYSGYLDDLRIAHQKPVTDIYDRIPIQPWPQADLVYPELQLSQKSAWVISKVEPLDNDKRPVLATLRFEADLPPQSQMQLAVRYHQKLFAPDLDEHTLPWHAVPVNHAFQLPVARFVQWRAHMQSDPDGQSSPVLRQVSIQSRAEAAPSWPRNFRAIPDAGPSGTICLEWMAHPGSATQSGSYYDVFIGYKSDQLAGAITIASDSAQLKKPTDPDFPLTAAENAQRARFPQAFAREFQGRLRYVLTNDFIIAQSLARDRNLPLIEPDRVYFFTIRVRDPLGQSSQTHPVISFVNSVPMSGTLRP